MSDADIVSLPNPATLFTHDRATNTAKCGKCRETKSGKWCRRFMTQHVMTHTGERPWGCPYCDFRSVRRHTMFRHLTQEHRSRGVRMTFKRRTITAVSVHPLTPSPPSPSYCHLCFSRTTVSSILCQESPRSTSPSGAVSKVRAASVEPGCSRRPAPRSSARTASAAACHAETSSTT